VDQAGYLLRERGFVRHKGKWRVPQEIELEQIREAQREIELEWSKKIRLWRSWATRRRNLAVDGMANLAAIDDPQAAPILAEMLQEKDEPRELRRIYVEVLGPMQVPASTFALARRVLD
jgi:HEAT repeat protein